MTNDDLMTNDEARNHRGPRVRHLVIPHSVDIRHSGFAIFLGSVLFFALTGCSSLDNDTIGATGKTPVPGEVNPDAPEAAQATRTSPGWNF
jgi:hypothetical protein